MGGSIRLVVVALVAALAVPACGGKEEAPTQAAPDPSTPRVVDDGTLADGGFYLPDAAAPVESLSG